MQASIEGAHFLVAEDDQDDRELLAEAFAEASVPGSLEFVEDGRALLDFLAPAASDVDVLPDLILLDLNMPRLDGHEVLARLKQDPVLRRTPVIVLSTSVAQEDISRAYDLGACSYITKPASFTALVTAVITLKEYWLSTVTLPDPI